MDEKMAASHLAAIASVSQSLPPGVFGRPAAISPVGGDTSDMYAFLDDINNENEKMLQAEQIKSEYAAKLSEQLRISKLLIGCILLFVGTIGNFLTYAVFRRQSLRSYATSVLFSVLALSNVVVLVLGLLPKMVEYEMKADLLRTSIPYACQIQVFLLYTFLHFTSWILVLVNVERFISVWFPQQSIQLCTVRNAKLAGSILLFIQVGYSAQLLVTMGTQEIERSGGPLPSNYVSLPENDTQPAPEFVCDAKPEFAHFHDRIFPVFHFAMFCFIPFVVMIILNGLIAGRLLLLGNSVVLAASPGSTEAHPQGRLLSGMTMTMFACSMSFFAFTLPVSLYIIVRRQMPEDEVRRNMAFYVMWTVLNLTQYVNNAAGLFYCLFGEPFRRELAKMFTSVINGVLDWLPVKRRLSVGHHNQDNNNNGGILLINGNNNNRLSAVYVGRTSNNPNLPSEKQLVETNFTANKNCQRNLKMTNSGQQQETAPNNNNNSKQNNNNKNCRILLVGDSEASAVFQTRSHYLEEQKRLLEQFGPSC